MVIETAVLRIGPAGLTLALVASAVGCARVPPPVATSPGPDACLLIPLRESVPETLTIAVNEPVDPGHAPVPRNGAEAVVFAHIYETPLRLDCHGRVVPGFATARPAPPGGAHMALRSGLSFSDGRPVTIEHVVEAWGHRINGLSIDWADGVIDLKVAGADAVPLEVLTGPEYGLVSAGGSGEFPVGTGPAARIVWRGRERIDVLITGPRALRFIVRPALDARDLLDLDADVVIAEDRAALDYAASRTDFHVVPLPWTRTYVLFAEWADRLDDALDGLARDVVPVDARAAAGPFWWDDPSCRPASRRGGPVGEPRRIVYDRGDPIGRALAERLVIRAPASSTVAIGLETQELERRLESGTEYAIVTVLPRVQSSGCRGGMRWGTRPPRALIDVRQSLFLRPGAGPVWVDGRGLPRFDPMP